MVDSSGIRISWLLLVKKYYIFLRLSYFQLIHLFSSPVFRYTAPWPYCRGFKLDGGFTNENTVLDHGTSPVAITIGHKRRIPSWLENSTYTNGDMWENISVGTVRCQNIKMSEQSDIGIQKTSLAIWCVYNGNQY